MIFFVFTALTRRLNSLRRRCYRLTATLTARAAGGRLEIGRNVRIEVPLRADGLGAVCLGEQTTIGFRMAPRFGNGAVLIQARKKDALIQVGRGTIINNNSSICANQSIEIGQKCLIGDMVGIYDSDFHEIDPNRRWESEGETAAVRVGNNVWLGSRVMILKGVEIGDDSVIAAGSIVTRNVPSGVLAAGAPARVIRQITE